MRAHPRLVPEILFDSADRHHRVVDHDIRFIVGADSEPSEIGVCYAAV